MGLLPIVDVSAQSGWQLQRTTADGIEIYFREEGDLKSVRLLAEVNGTIPQILGLLDSVQYYPDWVYRTSESQVLEYRSDTLYYYTRTDFPWPLQDRDFVIRSWTERGDTLTVSRSRAVANDERLRRSDAVRVRLFESDWYLQPLDSARTQVDYYLRTDPGGSIPRWIVNIALDRGPLKLVAAFRRRLNQIHAD